MTNEFDLAIEQIRLVCEGVTNCQRALSELPLSMQGIGQGKTLISVLMNDGDLGQIATGTRQETHDLIIRVYIPWVNKLEYAEQLARETLTGIEDAFLTNVGLSGASGVVMATITGNYRARFQTVSGTHCRVLDVPLRLIIRTNVTWS